MGLTLEANSKTGFDAVDSAGVKFQIKSRRLTKRNSSTQLSAIRNLDEHDFDYLIAVLFDEMFEVGLVVQLPYEIIGKYARFSKHVNAHLLRLKGDVLKDPLVEYLTPLFSNQEVVSFPVKVKTPASKTTTEQEYSGGDVMDAKLKKTIQSVGKGCFVKYYENFRDQKQSTGDLIELLMKEEGYTENACRTRISKSRKIINSGHAREVLRDITESTKLSDETIAKAKELLH
ncbi:MAG: hypothetical protein K8R77_16350 [Anaerolineaceae bacterium]|nr:hypothetical protein [Anaerolineaceae bacterium]